MPIVLLPATDIASITYALIEADGTEHVLDGGEGVWVDGTSQVGAPAVELIGAPIPFQPGSRLRSVQIRSREADLLLWVHASTNSGLRERLDRLARWLDPTRGDMRLRCYREDGGVRDLYCRLSGGMGTDYGRSGPGNQWVPITLSATQDPYTYELTPIAMVYTIGSTTGFFGVPFLPVHLSSSSVLATPSLENVGTVETWPIWTITGPGSDPAIRDLASGRSFAFDYTLSLGEQIIVDTRPAARRGATTLPVRSSAGDNLYASLSRFEADLFPLPVGSTPVQIAMTGATADSSVTVEYTTRWLTF